MSEFAKKIGVILSGALGIAALALICARPAKGQILYGSVVGTVTDQSGAVLPGAEVKITNDETGFTRQATANPSGQYRIADVPEGNYTISVSAKGFKPLRTTGIHVIIGQVNQQDVQMQVGAVTQEVTVEGSAVVLETQQTNVHTAISGTAVESLPLNIYHSFQSAEVLAPGVFSSSGITNSYPNSIADTADRSFAVNTNGLPQHINTTRVDGATNIFIWLPDHMVITPPSPSIEEVNVQTSNYSVQKGLTAGAATDLVTKSGTNQFHGSVYGFHTDNALNAQNTFVHVPSKPKDIRNNVGGTIGGPIKKDKAFFFFNWDGYFQRQSASTTHVIPTEDMRNGNFSSFLGDPLFDSGGNPVTVCTTGGGTTQLRQGMVFDPTTGNTATGQGRCAFANNIIPAGRMFQGALNFWKLMEPFQPNSALGPFTSSTALNDVRLRTSAWNRNIYTSRVDYDINSRMRLWGRYVLQKALFADGNDYGLAGVGGGTGVSPTTVNQGTVGFNWTVTPTLITTGTVGYSYMRQTNKSNDFGQPLGQSVLGLTNSNTPAGDDRFSGMPGILLAGFDDLGNSRSWQPVFRNDWTGTIDENNTLMRGNHTIDFGFDAVHHHLNHWQPEIVCCPRGAVSATEFNTFLNLAPGNGTGTAPKLFTSSGAKADLLPAQWNSVAAFNLGLANEVFNGNQFIKATNKEWQLALYVGDSWRATPRLTVDAGVRWEYFPVIKRDGVSQFEVYDPSANQLVLGGLGGHSTHLDGPLHVSSSKKLFAPRIGLAYRLNKDTVVRSAFGITYDSLPLSRPLRGFYPYTIGQDQFVTGNTRVTRFIPVSNFNSSTNTVNGFPGLNNGVPLITAPTGFGQGLITPPPDVVIGTLAPGEFRRAYVEQWNFTIERKLPYNNFLTVAYVGNHLVHQLNGRQLNAAPLGTGSAGQPLFSAFGRFQDTFQFQGYLDSHYNALQVSLKRAVSHGLFLQGSYTYSKAIGFQDDEGWENGLRFNCPPSNLLPQGCQQLNRHTLSFDHTHMLKMGFVYDLPFGTGEKFANTNRIASNVFGGWKINGIFSTWSGDPLELTQTSGFLNTPGTLQVPDVVGKLKVIGGRGPGQFYFDPTAFKPVETERIGTAGKSLSGLRGPGLAQLDFSTYRNFKLTERFGLRFSMEAQNLSNTPHFRDPGNFCRDINGACGGSFGQITSGFGERIIQFGAKVSF